MDEILEGQGFNETKADDVSNKVTIKMFLVFLSEVFISVSLSFISLFAYFFLNQVVLANLFCVRFSSQAEKMS